MKEYYIYAYTHPEYGYVYIGKTHYLENRIKSHDYNTNDNISREYELLLNKCAVFYFKLKSSIQMDYVEKYLIDFHKPKLNIQFKDERECNLEMSLPKWKRYIREHEAVVDDYVFNPNNHTLNYSKLLEEKIEELFRANQDLKKLEEELEHQIDLNGILKRRMKLCTL